MEIRRYSRFLALAGLFALALLSGCGGTSTNNIPTTVTVFYQHSVFQNRSTVEAVGYNGFGQLGDGSLNSRATASPVKGLGPMNGFAAGAEHTLAFSNNSSVMAWGFNNHGQLGNANIPTGTSSSTGDFSATPVRVGTLTHVTSIAAGAFHSLAVSDGKVFGWGNNSVGQLAATLPSGVVDAATPFPVDNAADGTTISNAIQVAAGANHSLALTRVVTTVVANDGTTTTLTITKVWAWGDNTYGQIGPNGTAASSTLQTPFNSVPVQVPVPGNVVQIAAAGSYSLALTDDGTVYAWGYNGFGQLGVPALSADTTIAANGFSGSPVPHQVKVVDSGVTLHIDKISAGIGHVLALVGDKVWGWGFDERGQLGDNPIIGDPNTSPNKTTPVQALKGGVPIAGVLDIQAFGNSSYAKLKNPTTGAIELWGWGDNSFGQLGAPVATSGIGYLVLPVQVAQF